MAGIFEANTYLHTSCVSSLNSARLCAGLFLWQDSTINRRDRCAFPQYPFFLLFAQSALAKESYICFLDKFMEVGNDGLFYGPDSTEMLLQINIEGKKVFYKMDVIKDELKLLDKLGSAQFAAKGGAVAMTTLHVWRRDSSKKHDVQYSSNYAQSITIRTGVCSLGVTRFTEISKSDYSLIIREFYLWQLFFCGINTLKILIVIIAVFYPDLCIWRKTKTRSNSPSDNYGQYDEGDCYVR